MFKKVSILYKENDDLAYLTAEAVKEWINEKNIQCIFFSKIGPSVKFKSKELLIIFSSDVLLVLGGDGTILSVARVLQGRKIPIIGINMGTLGFITEVSRENLFEDLEEIFLGRYKIEERSMIKVEVIRNKKNIVSCLGLNDMVVGTGIMAKIAKFDLTVNGVYVSSIRADGIIVSTPTGSTAYNLSAGGPILFPTLKTLVLTPICPHTLSVRPIVLPEDFVVEIVLPTDVEVFLTVDGHINFPLIKNDKVKCFIAEEKTYIVAPLVRDYFKVLREKLKWG